MTLREKQSKFVRMVSELIQFADSMGYELTFGDTFRDPRVFGELGSRRGYGAPNSLHKQRLAIDLNLFIDGVYQHEAESHRELGEFWEGIGGSWGMRYGGDSNHYELKPTP